MNDAGGRGGVLLQGVDVGHDIVSDTALFVGGHLECLVADDQVCADGIEGLVCDLSDAQFLFCFGEPQPELAPGRDALPRREDAPHLATCPGEGSSQLQASRMAASDPHWCSEKPEESGTRRRRRPWYEGRQQNVGEAEAEATRTLAVCRGRLVCMVG